MLKVSAILFLVSAFGTGLASNVQLFILARFIGGLAVGVASVLSPTYISEIAPASHRGRLIVSFQLAIVVGILVAFFVDYLLKDLCIAHGAAHDLKVSLSGTALAETLFRAASSQGFGREGTQAVYKVVRGLQRQQRRGELGN